MFSNDFKRQSRFDKGFDIINVMLLGIIMLAILYPLYFVVIASISSPLEVNAGQVLFWPKGVTLRGYQMIFRDQDILTGYRNTFFYTFLGTAINVTLTTFAAYPLARRDWVGRNFFMTLLLITMFFGGGLIPTYLVMNGLGVVNTIWAMVIPGAVSVYNVIVMRTYLNTSIPYELQEAATVDGASNFALLFRIVLPLSKPILAVLVLFYGVAHWNSFFNALIYISDKKLYPLQLVLRSILIQNQVAQDMFGDEDSLTDRTILAELIKYGLIIVSTLPVLILYPFMQRYFVKGVMIGAVKG
ncbi:MAG: carbohydrate ABC transporter permease [Clostridia bacterium]|nr:carbohydrate ABC transporter permease [Clostridia bacterium]MBO4884286.1 carbohydrate ABC transporter permease [Clostridia bacterium]